VSCAHVGNCRCPKGFAPVQVTQPAAADRLAAIEAKLDRVLELLDQRTELLAAAVQLANANPPKRRRR
jgi:hypothetical protein